MPDGPTPHVYWLTGARRALRAALARTLGGGTTLAPFLNEIDEISRQLGRVFLELEPECPASAVVVRERLSGFRRRDDLHILLVEVIPATDRPATPAPANSPASDGKNGNDGESGDSHSGPEGEGPATSPAQGIPGAEAAAHVASWGPRSYIVKLATRNSATALKKLADEWKWWSTVRPPGFEHDSMFVALRPFPRGATEPACLIYSHAEQVLGGQDVCSLEHAVLQCCRFGSPTAESIERLIRIIYQRLEAYFYVQTYIEKPARYIHREDDGNYLVRVVGQWDDRLTPADRKPASPVSSGAAADGSSPDGGPAPASTPSVAAPQSPQKAAEAPDDEPQLHAEDRLRIRRETLGFLSDQPGSFIDPIDYLRNILCNENDGPRIVCGCSHGDLNPRNVLASLDGDEAVGAALFDYESLRFNNVVGWDFVKLETELKVRVYDAILSGPEPQFIREVHRFERHLATQTEDLHYGRRLRPWSGLASLQRLEKLVLAIRSAAARCLGRNRHPPREWLEEYYFLLAWYGCYAAWFPSYQRRMVMAAYISAGTAARRRYRPWRELDHQIREARAKAADFCTRGDDPYVAAKADPWYHRSTSGMTFHVAFECAREWVRRHRVVDRDEAAVLKAVKAGASFLEDLRQRFPHVVAIEQELVLVYLDLGNVHKSREVLDGIHSRYTVQNHEAICREGRYWKELAFDPARESDREENLKRSLEAYERAFDHSGHYYPLVNVAALHEMRGDVDEARKAAAEVLRLADLADPLDDPVWLPATRGEALVLLGRARAARKQYGKAVARCRSSRDLESMKTQLVRLVQSSPRLCQPDEKEWSQARLDELFTPRQNGRKPPPPNG